MLPWYDDKEEETFDWKVESLQRGGINPLVAVQKASEVDLSLFRTLVKDGCPSMLALQIAT
jgi:hypothetical protein